MMLQITPELAIDESALEEKFIRAAGPGGQNVNKVSTAVQLRLDVARSGLPAGVQARLLRLAGSRATAEGLVLLEAREFRTQEKNREAARARLVALVQQALVVPKPRRATKPSRGAKERRLEGKKKRGSVKALRRAPPNE